MYSAFMQYNEVFVTGGTGLLGRYVCRALIGQGFLPRLLVRNGSEGRIEPDVRERCRVTPGDLTVLESAEMGAQGTSAICAVAPGSLFLAKRPVVPVSSYSDRTGQEETGRNLDMHRVLKREGPP